MSKGYLTLDEMFHVNCGNDILFGLFTRGDSERHGLDIFYFSLILMDFTYSIHIL